LLLGDGLQHLRDSSAVLGVEVSVDFVKEVEGCGVALLDGKDEGKSTEAWMMLVEELRMRTGRTDSFDHHLAVECAAAHRVYC
jgi:hypothetical protein